MTNWSTDKQREAAVKTMRVLGNVEKVGAEKLTKALTHPEKGPYKRVDDAKEVVKELENNEQFPVIRENGFLKRTDIQHEVEPKSA